MENSLEVPQMVKYRVTMTQQPPNMKAYVHIKICTWIFVATIFVKVKKKKTRKKPSVHQYINGQTHYGISIPRNCTQQYKGMNY